MKLLSCLTGLIAFLVALSSVAAPTECLVLFEGKENAKHSIDLPFNLGKLLPHKVNNSQVGDKWLWLVVLAGDDCTKATKTTGYIGKSMEEFLKLPDAQKARFLKVRGQCKMGTEMIPCEAPWGDKKVNPYGIVYFPVNFINPPALRYPAMKDGKVAKIENERPVFPGF